MGRAMQASQLSPRALKKGFWEMNAPAAVYRRTLFLFILVYATMFLFGFVENIKGVAYPLLKSEFGAGYVSQGGLVSLTWFGYVFSCLAASLFMDRFGIKKSILAGYVLIGFGTAAVLTAPTFWAAGAALLIVNTGFGFFEIGNNAMGTVVFTKKAALMMNLLHFFYGLGAVLGPRTAGMLTHYAGFSWRQVYLAALIPVGFFFVLNLFAHYDAPSEASMVVGETGGSFLASLKEPVVWLFCLTLGFMEVIEFGAANWGGLHLKDVYGLDPRVTGAAFVSLFYVLFTISRLLNGFFIERIGYIRSLYGSLILILLVFVLGFSFGRTGIWILPVTGFFIGILWPTLMAVVMEVFRGRAHHHIGAIITVSGAINGVFQWVIGLTNHYLGEAWGYRTCVLYGLAALYCFHMLVRRVRKDLPVIHVNTV